MTLRHIGSKEKWNATEPINGIRYQSNIDKIWSADELKAIGLEIVPIAPPAEKPPRPPVTSCDFVTFMGLFTHAEAITIKTASMQNAEIGLWYDQAVAENWLELKSEKVGQGFAVLVGAGLIGQARADEILATVF
jgi:hypothetical protein